MDPFFPGQYKKNLKPQPLKADSIDCSIGLTAGNKWSDAVAIARKENRVNKQPNSREELYKAVSQATTLQNTLVKKSPAMGLALSSKIRTPIPLRAVLLEGNFFGVRSRGFEPPRVAPLEPESSASANSATSAFK